MIMLYTETNMCFESGITLWAKAELYICSTECHFAKTPVVNLLKAMSFPIGFLEL